MLTIKAPELPINSYLVVQHMSVLHRHAFGIATDQALFSDFLARTCSASSRQLHASD
jgi:hypothetical protein